MAENKLEIVISASDEASEKLNVVKDIAEKSANGIKAAFERASKATEDFSEKAKALGRSISSTGQTMTFLGAGITAPFILALKGASEHSTALKMRMDNLKAIFEELQI